MTYIPTCASHRGARAPKNMVGNSLNSKGRLQKKNVKLGLLAEVRGGRGPSGF